jgi:hypothetical protein
VLEMRKLTNVLDFIPSWLAAFFHLWMLMFIVSLPALPFLLGKSVSLNCNRWEINYVNCQYQRVHFYGLWTEPAITNRLKSVVIEEYEIHHEDSTSTGYKLYLNNQGEGRYFYDYGTDAYRAKNDKYHLDNFRLGNDNASLNLQLNKGFWGEIALIPVGSLYVLTTVFVIIVIVMAVKKIANNIS